MKLGNSSLYISAVLMGALLTGCGSNTATAPNPASSAQGSQTQNTSREEGASNQEAGTTPYGKYPETMHYTIGISATNYDGLKGTGYEGDDDANNAWTRYVKDKLNAAKEDVFEANDGDDYKQKVSMAIVSGDIPDIMIVSDYDTLKQLYENDLIADLTEAYANCASDRIKDIYNSYNGHCLDTAKIDGKLVALPTTEISHGPGVLWLRKDWMDKLGLSAPKTINDIENILQAFVDKDPGGNGPEKTVGLVVDTNVAGTSGGAYMVNNIFTLYGAFPKQWIDNGNGNAVYGSIQPEMKTALEKLADWYSKGLIDRELAVRTGDDRKALLTSGQSGAVMDNWWGSWTVAETRNLNPEAEWVPYICPVDQHGEVTVFTGNPNSSYAVVRKGFEHPELLLKLADLQFDYSRYLDTDKNSTKEIYDYINLNIGGGIIPMNIDYFDAMVRGGVEMRKALDENDPSGLSIYNRNAYNGFRRYRDNIKTAGIYDWAGYMASVDCTALAGDSKIKEVTPAFFGNTPSISLKWPTLDKMELEMYLKIIMGEEPVDYFDTFVENWEKTGGAQITKEVNQAISKKNQFRKEK